MKKFRRKDNYNAIITIVLVVMLILAIKYACAVGIAVWRIVAWDMQAADLLYLSGTVMLALPFVVLAFVFVIQAVRRDPKMMIGAIVSLAAAAVTGVSFGAVICMAACGYWLWMVTRAHQKPFMKCVKWAIVTVTVLVIGLELIGGILSMGYWDEWGPVEDDGIYNSLEEGSWDGWTTMDEDGNMVYIDEDGNGSTYERFEFE